MALKLDEINNATPEQLDRARAARSPVTALSAGDFAQLRGKLVALLLDGPDKGKIIAVAPLDQNDPELSRRSISKQVGASPYKHRRYQLCQVLDKTATD